MAEPQAPANASWTDTIYNLNRGSIDDERERLAYNHFHVWLPLTGDLLPPHILSALRAQEGRPPRIADVATGSGVWLTSVSEIVPPRSELYGFDFDQLKMPTPPMPPPQQQQPTLEFRKHDVLQPFPAEFRGTFDLVHVRLLALGLKKDDWDVAVGHLRALLAPGGWLFWEDISDLFIRFYPLSRAYEEFWWVTMQHDAKVGRDRLIPMGLLKKFQKLGFQNCEQKIWNSWAADESVQDEATAGILRLIRPSLMSIVEDGGEDTVKTMEDVSRIERDLRCDVEGKGSRTGFDFIWNWGQRPG
ncbi:methyltransferase domain-containing protein [Colletotrichum orchidophilum]|uniref:Methyltransferase domain-containing protein n=1 Tax=Colletotrichum orchidophilum TaxID=1209926 RepID=A0A1G4BN87_9PEZI|nr:methyltransferase domain-containing protein [Colletotrichum orchidophilum]OHF02874.1 methyltransferase domain-containing protein [Colletotrichum orchidophilum]